MPDSNQQSVPNPGSDEARELGCKCAVLDNNRGKFAPWPPDGWWINESCPVHVTVKPRGVVIAP